MNSPYSSIKTVLIVQVFVSSFIAILVICAAIWSGLDAKTAKLFDLMSNLSGVIIGFYFGTAFTQIATLARALRGEAGPE